MANNLVLDTNIWLGFIENLEFDLVGDFLDQIENGTISIILPEDVKKEFDKKLDEVIQKTLKKTRISSADLNTIVQIIDYIFGKSLQLQTQEIGVKEWVDSREAPNHNGNNFEDTFILNTLLSRLEKNTSFLFVSLDTDYRLSKIDNSIHPDIKNRFNQKQIDIDLSTNLKKTLYHDLKISPKEQSSQESYELYDWKLFKMNTKSKGLLDQLRHIVEYYYKELDFIPLSYLSNIFPFRESMKSHTHAGGLEVTTNNQKLFIFFQNGLIEDDKGNVSINTSFFQSDKDSKDFEEIVKKLNSNLVYSLKYEKEQVYIYLEDEEEETLSDCDSCLLQRHAIIDLSEKIDWDESESPKVLLRKAYNHFKLKNVSEALKITQVLTSKTNPKDNPIIYFITQKNLSILKGMWFQGGDDFRTERDKVKLTRENEILGKGISSLVGYFWFDKFFDYKFFDLTKDLENVKERYRIHQGIGNSHIFNVDAKNIYRWAELINVISKNGLFFERFSNIIEFARLTFKQHIYAFKDRSLEIYIDEFLFKTTLPYLKLKEYKDIFFELGVTELRFQKDHLENIYQLFCLIIENFSQVNSLGTKHDYYRYYITQVKTIVFLLGYIPFSKSKLNCLLTEIYEMYSNTEEEDRRFVFQSVVKNKAESINRKNALTYFNLLLEGQIDYSFNINHVLILSEQLKSINLTNEQFEILLSKDIEKQTGYNRSQILYWLYDKIDNLKDKVIKEVEESLCDKSSFDIKTYILFSRKKVIQPTAKYDRIFLEIVTERFHKERQKYYSDPSVEQIENLDELNQYLDYIYLFQEKPYDSLKRFMGRSDYYDFMINPTSFDEESLDVHWFYIAHHYSYFAMKRILSCYPEIKKIVSDAILKSRNDKYLRAYVALTKDHNE